MRLHERAILSCVFEISVGDFHFSEGSQAHRQPFLCFSNAAVNLHHGFKTTAFTAQSSPKDGFLRHLAEAGQSRLCRRMVALTGDEYKNETIYLKETC